MTRTIVTTTRQHATADMRVALLGAWRTVTGAMSRVDGPATSLLVDCGLGRGHDANATGDLDEARHVDAVILTHGHIDHVGRLPELFEAGYDGPVYGTRATLGIAEINLRDSLRLASASQGDIRRFLARYQACQRILRYDTPARLGELDVVLRDAGHILGSSSVEVASAKSRLVLSGDLGRPGTPLLRDPFTAWPAPVDLVVMESTYGSREHPCSPADARAKLRTALRRTVEGRGHLLIPAFAIGRTQTILYHLNALIEDGEVPPVPVAVDTPMGIRITELHDDAHRLFDADALRRIALGDDPLDFDSLYAVRRGRDSHRLRDMPGPLVIIAGSGMCTGGRIVRHLLDRLPEPTTTVLLVGYQAPGTPGRALQRANPGDPIDLDGERVPIAAHIETLSGLSAHADRRELATWLDAIPGHPNVALHHGDVGAQEALAEWLG